MKAIYNKRTAVHRGVAICSGHIEPHGSENGEWWIHMTDDQVGIMNQVQRLTTVIGVRDAQRKQKSEKNMVKIIKIEKK